MSACRPLCEGLEVGRPNNRLHHVTVSRAAVRSSLAASCHKSCPPPPSHEECLSVLAPSLCNNPATSCLQVPHVRRLTAFTPPGYGSYASQGAYGQLPWGSLSLTAPPPMLMQPTSTSTSPLQQSAPPPHASIPPADTQLPPGPQQPSAPVRAVSPDASPGSASQLLGPDLAPLATLSGHSSQLPAGGPQSGSAHAEGEAIALAPTSENPSEESQQPQAAAQATGPASSPSPPRLSTESSTADAPSTSNSTTVWHSREPAISMA